MGLMDKMKQAKDMYGNMKKIQQELNKIQVTGKASNNLVTVIAKGNHSIISIKIDDSLSNNTRDLEKHILDACNDALTKVDQEIKTKMGGLMNMPSGFKLPF